MGRPAAKSTMQIDNARTVVTEWCFAPGAETGWHIHKYDYIVVPQLTGQLLIEKKSGSEQVTELHAGITYFRQAGVEHNVVNNNDYAFSFIEVELK